MRQNRLFNRKKSTTQTGKLCLFKCFTPLLQKAISPVQYGGITGIQLFELFFPGPPLPLLLPSENYHISISFLKIFFRNI